MLDRGELKDWFGSAEIMTYAALAGLGLYMLLVHMATAERPFLDPELFRDRNLCTGLVFIFVVGIVLLATLALLPPFLQDLMGYPVLTTGLVLAPRGVGTMIAMLLVGRLIGRMDPRAFIVLGLLLAAQSLWAMAGFTTEVDIWTIVGTGITQGLGLGFIFVPLSTLTFATLPVHLRTEAAGMFSLMRNMGSSIGISVVETLLARNTQINHSALAANISPFNPVLRGPAMPPEWSLDSAHGLAALNAEITRQAATIAYLDDFRLMMYVMLIAMPLVVLLRRPQSLRVAQIPGD
jgi:DHA2 family multidrug resistance protein